MEILRRLYPVADIRPMDLYPLPGKPRIFDLRVATPQAGQWDVVAVFNWSSEQNATIRLDPQDLGWAAGRTCSTTSGRRSSWTAAQAD